MTDIIGKTFPVLGNGSVTLLDVLPHPATGTTLDQAVVEAARTSFLGESKGEEKDKKLLFYLMKHHHDTPFEQAEFKFRLYAPVMVLWHIVRHRTAHINMSSGRYTTFKEDDFYTPDRWRAQSADNKQGSDGFVDGSDEVMLGQHLDELYALGYRFYKDALERGAAKEQARLFLPAWGSMYACVFKIDARNLMHFLRLRHAPDAQFETREYARVMHDIFAVCMPWTAEAFETYVLKEGAHG